MVKPKTELTISLALAQTIKMVKLFSVWTQSSQIRKQRIYKNKRDGETP